MDAEIERRIAAVIEERQPVTTPQIAAAADTHPMTVRRHCLQLQQAGHIRQVTGGAYVRVDAGQDECRASD